jgi:hypothetical protein
MMMENSLFYTSFPPVKKSMVPILFVAIMMSGLYAIHFYCGFTVYEKMSQKSRVSFQLVITCN